MQTGQMMHLQFDLKYQCFLCTLFVSNSHTTYNVNSINYNWIVYWYSFPTTLINYGAVSKVIETLTNDHDFP